MRAISTIIKMTLTPFEEDLMRLKYIENKVAIIWKTFPTLPSEPAVYTFKSMLREYVILILDSFIEAREAILKDFVDMGKPKLDLALRSLSAPILEHEKTIRKLRDNYIAHIQTGKMKESKPFEILVDDFITSAGFPSSAGDTLLMVGCVRLYIEFVRMVFVKEWEAAEKKYNAMKTGITPIGIYAENQVAKVVKDRGNEAVSKLKQFGIADFHTIP